MDCIKYLFEIVKPKLVWSEYYNVNLVIVYFLGNNHLLTGIKSSVVKSTLIYLCLNLDNVVCIINNVNSDNIQVHTDS